MKLVEFPKKEDGPDKNMVEMVDSLLERTKNNQVRELICVGINDEDMPFIMIGTDYISAHALLAIALKEI